MSVCPSFQENINNLKDQNLIPWLTFETVFNLFSRNGPFKNSFHYFSLSPRVTWLILRFTRFIPLINIVSMNNTVMIIPSGKKWNPSSHFICHINKKERPQKKQIPIYHKHTYIHTCQQQTLPFLLLSFSTSFPPFFTSSFFPLCTQ